MPFAFQKLDGLDGAAISRVLDPVLLACGVSGVELIWRTGNQGWVLYVSVERPETTDVGAGLTLDDCAAVSRAVSAALDEAELIGPAYRLEVGTPGVERALYNIGEYRRFTGQLIHVKLREELEGQRSLRGRLTGVSDDDVLQLDTDHERIGVSYSAVTSGRLVLDMADLNKVRSGQSSHNNRPKQAGASAGKQPQEPTDGR